MSSRSLKVRILSLLGILLGLVSLAVLAAVWHSTTTHARQQLSQSLQLGEQVLRQALANRQTQLVNSVEVLTADFGFKQAVATADSATILSVLQNHGSRISADLMTLLSLDGKVIASTLSIDSSEQQSALDELLNRSVQDGAVATIIALDDALFQIILMPVRAPVPIAIAAIGFQIDQGLAEQLKSITLLEISFAMQNTRGETAQITTLSRDRDTHSYPLEGAMTQMRLPFLSPDYYAYRELLLNDSGAQQQVTVRLFASLDHAFAEFDKLQLEIIAITLLTLSLALLGGAIFSRRLTRPVFQLLNLTQDIASGNYNKSLSIDESVSELTELASAFKSMQQGIQEREDRITFQATHDPLTGSLNRQQLLAQFSQLITERASCHLAVVCMNIRDFRVVNETFGYAIGDECLKIIHRRLEEESANTLVNARVGADEFIAVVKVHGALDSIVERLKGLLEQTCPVESMTIPIAFNMGVADYPNHDQTAEGIVQKASIALDIARRDNLGIAHYRPGMEEDRTRRLQLLNALKQVLSQDNDQLRLNYQPKLSVARGEVLRAEALIRWIHPEQGFISPELFIPLAEQAGLIGRITDWVVARVIQDIRQWREEGFELQVAINLSAQDLSRPELLDAIHRQLLLHDLPTHALAFEITESAVMEDAEQAINLLNRFRESGFDLAIDDFGTGFSSLSQLKNMPVTELKIDRSFVMQLPARSDDQIIVRSTLELARNFQLEVVAEGVEDRETLDLLGQWGCEWAQGYFISKPIPSDQVVRWLTDFRQASRNNPLISAKSINA